MRVSTLSAAIACTLLLSATGCTATTPGMASKVSTDMSKEVARLTPAKTHFGLERVSDARSVPGAAYADIDLNDDSGSVSINVSGPIGAVVKSYVDAIGYGLAWSEGVSKDKSVSLSMSGVSEKTAIRKLAAGAGYVAVFDHHARLVTMARTATYVFHMPRHVMQAESTTWSMSNSGSSGGGGSSSSGSSSSSSGSGGLTGRAQFSATGTASNPAPSIRTYLANLAGSSASVTVSPEAGHIAVRGDGVAIERVRGYLQKMADQAMRQVQIDVAVIDIGIGRESSYGIDWSNMLSALNGTLDLALTTAADVASPALAVNFTQGSIASVLNLLRTRNDLKIVTQPRITATNGVPTMIFDGQEIPYLGEITTTTSTVAGGAPTQGGTVSYATDGVSMSVVTDILSDSEAHLTLVPTISAVKSMSTFTVAGSQMVAPTRTTKEALVSTTLRDGMTTVIGGIRYTRDTSNKKLLPGVDIAVARDTGREAREIAILLHARISPEKHQSILFAESL